MTFVHAGLRVFGGWRASCTYIYDSYTDLDERGFWVELQQFAERVAFVHGASKVIKVSTLAWPAPASGNKDQEMDAHEAACHTRVL